MNWFAHRPSGNPLKRKQEQGKVILLQQHFHEEVSDRSGSLLGLSDTPDSYLDQWLKILRVKSDESWVEFVDQPAWWDMAKSVYDTNNDWIVNSAHKELVSFINKTGATLTKGTIVYLKSSSSSWTHPEALKASATTEAMSSKTVWAIYEDVANDWVWYIVTSGEVDNLNTSSYTIGTKLWLSTTAWEVTITAPTAPNHAVFIGTVTRSQESNGRILYAIQNGYEYEELHNVSTTEYTAIEDADLVSIKEEATWLWKPTLWSNIKSLLWNNAQLVKPTIKWSIHNTNSPTDASTINLDLSSANDHRIIIAWNRTITLTNASINQKFTVRIQQDTVWSRLITWFGTIKWAWWITPTLTTTANKADMFWFVCTWTNQFDWFIIWQNI